MKKYTVKELIPILGITKQNINRAIDRGDLVATRMRDRGPWEISERSVRNFIEQRKLGALKTL